MDFLKPKTGYRRLISYHKATCVYDVTYHFIERFLDKRDRTYDQMLQAARSGKQNIVEGRCAATTSKETEIKLYNVAKASLHELLADYEDYIRTRGLNLWTPAHERYGRLRDFCLRNSEPHVYVALLSKMSPEEICNMAITLIHQTDAMLGKLIEYAKADFLRLGGAREEMSRARINERNFSNVR